MARRSSSDHGERPIASSVAPSWCWDCTSLPPLCSRHGSPALGEVEPGELRDAVTYTRAFLHVAGELEVIARGIRDTVTAKRGDVAGRGLLVYKLSQMYGEDADPQLPKLIAAMRRALGRGRRPSR